MKTAERQDPGTAIITPVTVAQMTAAYNDAIRMVDEGYSLLDNAQARLKAVFGGDSRFAVQDINNCYDSNAKTVKQQLHREVWRTIIDKLEIRKILSIKRNEELAKRLESGDLPPITDEEIFTMINSLRESAPDFVTELALEVYDFLRPAVSSSRWEKAYVTNQRNGKYDLGKRVILGWMVRSRFGYNNFQVNFGYENKLFALDRVFALMDGKQTPTNAYKSPLVDAINTYPGGWGETEYFKFRACHNGNLHLEFKRLDLLQRLNELAGNPTELKGKKYKTRKGDKTTVNVPQSPEAEAERFEEAFYWTPGPVIGRMLELVPLKAGGKILEPNAGEGHIVDSLVSRGAPKDHITCIEINPDRAATLRSKGYTVKNGDFLRFHEAGWDCIFMNPPFSQEQEIRHVMHAYSLLAPGGCMVSVMSTHGFYAVNQRCQDFRAWFNKVGARAEDLPAKSFRMVGTDIDTKLVVIQK